MSSKKRATPGKGASTIDMPMTREELELLRDIFGLVTPVRGEDGDAAEGSVTGLLAEVTGRAELEESLWEKVSRACERVGILVGESAPSFAVSAQDVPSMYVYKLED